MKTLLAASAIILLSAFSASAIELQTPVARQLYTCGNSAMSRVALQTSPAPCCAGQLKCPQFLSTQGYLREQPANRT